MKIDKSKDAYDKAALKVLAQVRQCELLFFGQGMRVLAEIDVEGVKIGWYPRSKRFQVDGVMVSGDPATVGVDHHSLAPYVLFLEHFPALYAEAQFKRDAMRAKLEAIAVQHEEWVAKLGPMRVIEPG